MMLFKKLQLVLVLGFFGLGMTACGDSDRGVADKSKSMTQKSIAKETMTENTSKSVALPAYDPDVPSMVVEDNGVVHEDAIYKAWPK